MRVMIRGLLLVPLSPVAFLLAALPSYPGGACSCGWLWSSLSGWADFPSNFVPFGLLRETWSIKETVAWIFHWKLEYDDMIRVSLLCLWKAAHAVCSVGDSYCMIKIAPSTGGRTGTGWMQCLYYSRCPKALHTWCTRYWWCFVSVDNRAHLLLSTMAHAWQGISEVGSLRAVWDQDAAGLFLTLFKCDGITRIRQIAAVKGVTEALNLWSTWELD